MGTKIDLTGKKFNALLVLREVEKGLNGRTRWLCLCDCGKEIPVQASNLGNNHTTSCGCLKLLATTKANTTHGCSYKNRTSLYGVWGNIKQRCETGSATRSEDYKGRGIRLHPDWLESFEVFKEYIETTLGVKPSEAHTLDRKDNTLGYVPGNLRWATKCEQARNRRVNKIIEYQGETKCLSEWVEVLNLPYDTVKQRLNKLGWTVEKAFTTSLNSRNFKGK